jgi:hypothetical protein
MYCPKCGRENPDDARICSACNSELPAPKKVNVRTSKLAVASLLCGLASLVLFFVAFFFDHSHVYMAAYVVTAWSTLILGVVSMFQIGFSAGRLTGIAFAVIGTAIPAVTFLLVLSYAVLQRPRSTAYRMKCGVNLSRMGKAMLMYANDYEDQFPRAGGAESVWRPKINDWRAEDRAAAFGLQADGAGGAASISSSFYLLVKYEQVRPETFVCHHDKGTSEFTPANYGVRDKELIDLWDFGPEPWKHCSYTYHNPYGPYALSVSNLPGMAVAADRSPWIDSPAGRARDFGKFDPNDLAPLKAQKHGNSPTHHNDGQNVLFVDTHVTFERRAYCGINDDNIYTFWSGANATQAQRMRGRPPGLDSQPAGRVDSLLVHDPPMTEPK